jgi:single-strand DNA-binding protein
VHPQKENETGFKKNMSRSVASRQGSGQFHVTYAWSKLGEFALTLTKGAHLQVEGELRSREYEKDGVKRRIWECKAYRIAKLDRIERADDTGRSEDATDDGPPF